MDDLTTLNDLAERMHSARSSIGHLIDTDPDFPRPFKIGRRLYLRKSEVNAYLERKAGGAGNVCL
jgi:predicted DNA-binding transcriptional regulator AlpA